MEPTRHTYFDSPVGSLLLIADADGLCEISFEKRGRPVPAPADSVEDARPLRETARQLRAYFAGRLDRFDLPLSFHGTPFQLQVWQALTRIPYGQTLSYGELAGSIGRPAASRAVGAANGKNPISIVVPCHRVIGADGSLTGFGGGLPVKRALLQLEGVLPAEGRALFD